MIRFYSVSLFIIVLTSLLTSSCSYIWVRKNVAVHSDKGAVVYRNGEEVGKEGSKVRIAKRKAQNFHEFEVTKEDHKTRTEVIYPSALNFGTLTSAIFFQLAVVELFGYHKTFKKNWYFKLTPYPDLKDAQHHISFSSVKLNDNINITSKKIVGLGKYKKGIVKTKQAKEPYKINDDINERTLTSRSNLLLEQIGATNNGSIHISHYNEYTITAQIESIEVLRGNFYKYRPDFIKFNIVTDFTVVNPRGDTVLKRSISSSSGHFFENKYNKNYYMLVDALDYAVIDLLNDKKLRFLLINKDIPSVEAPSSNNLVINNVNTSIASIQNVYEDYYTLNAGNDTLKSICLPISKDGILIASSYALNYSNELAVYDRDSNKYEIEILKEIPGKEIAFIKIDKEFETVFSIAQNNTPERGETPIYAVGFESYFDELLVTQGVISAIRSYENSPFYQIDASCQNQIFPFVLNEKAEIIGILTKSLLSGDVEGISFCSVIGSE